MPGVLTRLGVQMLGVEQDLIVCRALTGIFRDPVLSQKLVVRGGTALHKLYFHPPRRFSEDIDLVQIESGPIGPIFDALREVLAPILGKPKRKTGNRDRHAHVSHVLRNASRFPLRLKVEINSREHFAILGIQKIAFAIESPWLTDVCEVMTFAVEELLGTKLRALYQRRKGRDLFDLWLGLTEWKADPQKVVDCFRQYMEHKGRKVSRSEFAENDCKETIASRVCRRSKGPVAYRYKLRL